MTGADHDRPQDTRRRRDSRSSGVSSLAAASPARAAESATAPETIVLKAAHVFDSIGTALKDGATIVVRGDRIVSVSAAAAPAGARVIDLGDATLLPGFIDAHTHLTMQFEKDYYHYFYTREMRFPAEQACTARCTRGARSRPASRRCATSARTTSSTSAYATPSTPASPRVRAC